MVWKLVGTFHGLLQKSVEGVLTALIYAAIAVAVANRVGWLDRWIWFILEKEGQKALNGARVTIGSFTIEWSELLQGKITLHASNAVIHTPQRDEWQWDSPLIARIGKSTVECNALITVFHAVFLGREVPIEAYTIIVSDVQVFVERRKSVINVYLLNPTLQLPPPPYARKVGDRKYGGTGKGSATVGHDQNNNIAKSNDVSQQPGSEIPTTSVTSHTDTAECDNTCQENANDSSLQTGQKGSTTFFDTKSSINPLGDGASSEHDNHNQQAKVLVSEMLHAVQVLGGAAARGQLPGAIKRQGLELVGRLQGFREQQNLEEGIRVMQQVGRVAVESIQSAPRLILPQPDNTRDDMIKKIIYIRIGRIVANDLRIFTKDSWINGASTQEEFADSISGSAIGNQNMSNNPSLLSPSTKQNDNDTNKTALDTSTTEANMNHNGNWNRPIYIQTMILRSSELCPPMSMKDGNNLPAIFQSVDKIGEVVWRRILAEIAKSNSGRLFSTALGEMLSVMSTAGAASPVSGPSNNTNMGSITTSAIS